MPPSPSLLPRPSAPWYFLQLLWMNGWDLFNKSPLPHIHNMPTPPTPKGTQSERNAI